jgi:hypothetical protein
MSEDSANKNDPLPTLDYATPVPHRRSGRMILLGFCGIFVGLIGFILLMSGIHGAADAIVDPKTSDRANTILAGVDMIWFGGICLYVSFRWCRTGFSRK